MRNLNNIIGAGLGLYKSVYVNLKFFKLKDAIKLPIIISNNVKIKSLKGQIKINGDIKTAMIKIGFGDIGTFDIKRRKSILEINGVWECGNNINLGHGTKISIGKLGILRMKNNITISAESAIICHNDITIGDNFLMSWDNIIMDTDFHKIKYVGENYRIINNDLPIVIEDNVWIGCRCTILKGTRIRNNSVLSATSRISKNIDESNVLIGNNGKIIKRSILWEE
ncbi:hypothetical protein ACSW9O_12500 [Clostridium perfringens]|uniref:hypothetical protein n=1 Tax=Clostridium perfringens TaxID=1502 RepID=UPI002908C2B1|nr:hypothetical protein [Clostridium perfringens]